MIDRPFRPMVYLTVVLASLAVTTGAAAQQVTKVMLPQAAQVAQGVRLAALQPAGPVQLADAVASVRDASPLLATAAQLTSARAQVHADSAAVVAARAEAARLQALLAKGYIAKRDVQVADATAAAALAVQEADVARLAALQAGALAQWGGALASQAARGTSALSDYAEGRASLIELALPDEPGVPAPSQITLRSASGGTDARLLGPAPRTDAIVQGASYFYRAAGGDLRSGQRLAVSMALPRAAATAVQVPDNAVIWYAGEPWVYVEQAPGQFMREPLPARRRGAAGWVVSRRLHAGQRVVVRGAELLLTQELKPPPGAQPSGGDDDDD